MTFDGCTQTDEVTDAETTATDEVTVPTEQDYLHV